MYLPLASAATVPSSRRISPLPSKRRRVSRVMRPTQRSSPVRGSGLRKRAVSSAVTPYTPGSAMVMARPMVSSRMAVLMPPCRRPG